MENNNWKKFSEQIRAINKAGYAFANNLKKQREAISNYSKEMRKTADKLTHLMKSI